MPTVRIDDDIYAVASTRAATYAVPVQTLINHILRQHFATSEVPVRVQYIPPGRARKEEFQMASGQRFVLTWQRDSGQLLVSLVTLQKVSGESLLIQPDGLPFVPIPLDRLVDALRVDMNSEHEAERHYRAWIFGGATDPWFHRWNVLPR